MIPDRKTRDFLWPVGSSDVVEWGMEKMGLIDPEELEEDIERAEFRPGGGGRKSRKDAGFGLERKGKMVKEKISLEAQKSNQELKNAKRALAEKIQRILEKESNPALHKGITNYFEWVRYGLLALGEEGQRQEIMKDQDLDIDFVRASGPGGQNVNKTSSAVAIRHMPSKIFLKEMGARTQPENLKVARERMLAKLADHLNKWKLVAGGKDQNGVMAEMFEGGWIPDQVRDDRKRGVLKDIRERLEDGRNL